MKNYMTLLLTLALVIYGCSDNDPITPDPPVPNPGTIVPPIPTPNGNPVNMWAIDMTPLEINGKYYAVWSGWADYWVGNESLTKNQNLYIAEMFFNYDYPKVSLGKRHLLAIPELDWELKVGENFSLVEAPQVLKNGDDVFIIYSTRGSWTINYKLGQLKLKSKTHDPLKSDSWTKKAQPVFKGLTDADGKGYRVYGLGHACFTVSPDGTEQWVNYHSKTFAARGWDDRMVYFQKFKFDANGEPDFGIPANSALPMTRPSGEVAIEKSKGVQNPSDKFTNPIREGSDPWIVKHGDYYYTCRSIERGIWVTKSRYISKFEDANGNEVTWEKARRKVWTPPAKDSNKWNRVQHWAPELHFINGKWYIFYAGGQQTEEPYWQHRAGVLICKGDDPWVVNGFEEHGPDPLFTGEIKNK